MLVCSKETLLLYLPLFLVPALWKSWRLYYLKSGSNGISVSGLQPKSVVRWLQFAHIRFSLGTSFWYIILTGDK